MVLSPERVELVIEKEPFAEGGFRSVQGKKSNCMLQ